MKQYVKINNLQEMERLLKHFKIQGWKANTPGLVARIKDEKNYPFVIGNCDNYGWYMNDEGTDTNMYISLHEALFQANLTVEKTIYVPYNSWANIGFDRGGITIKEIKSLYEDGKLNPNNVGIRYVERYIRLGAVDTPFLNHTKKEKSSSWLHLDCKINYFKIKNLSSIKSYTEIGKPNFINGERHPNNLSKDFWEIGVSVSPDEEKISKAYVEEAWVEIIDYNGKPDPYSGVMSSIRIPVEEVYKPSYYLYYCLF